MQKLHINNEALKFLAKKGILLNKLYQEFLEKAISHTVNYYDSAEIRIIRIDDEYFIQYIKGAIINYNDIGSIAFTNSWLDLAINLGKICKLLNE